MADEKRKFMRFQLPLNVELKASVRAPECTSGKAKDVSREGVSFVAKDVDANVGESACLEIKIQLPGKEESITACGDIMWKKKVPEGWQVGIKFTQIDAVGKGDILSYAYEQWVDKMRGEKK